MNPDLTSLKNNDKNEITFDNEIQDRTMSLNNEHEHENQFNPFISQESFPSIPNLANEDNGSNTIRANLMEYETNFEKREDIIVDNQNEEDHQAFNLKGIQFYYFSLFL